MYGYTHAHAHTRTHTHTHACIIIYNLLTIDDTKSSGDNIAQPWSKFKVSIAQVVDEYISHKLAKKRGGLP